MQGGQQAFFGEDVPAFADVAHDGLFLFGAVCRTGGAGVDLQIVEGIVHGGASQHVEAHVRAHIAGVAVVFHVVDAGEDHAAFGGHVAARFHEEASGIARFGAPAADEIVELFGQVAHIETGLPFILMVRDAEAAAEVDDLQTAQHVGGQAFGQLQQDGGRRDVAVGFHEEGADVVVDAGQAHVVALEDGQHLVQQIGGDAELGLLAGGDHFLMVARADAGIEAHHDPSAAVEAAEGLQLGEGIHADEHALLQRVAHLVGGDVVGDVEDLVRGEAGQLVEVELAGAHGIDHEAFFTDDAQQHGIGIGLDRIVDAETGVGGQGHQFAAAAAQHVFVVNIEGGAPFFQQLGGRIAAEEGDLVAVAGTDVGHGIPR